MDFAATKQLISPPVGNFSSGDAATMLWENGMDESLARQDTWLLSFIDILALLLTLFVLLLAYQGQGQKESDIEHTPATPLTIPFNLSQLAFQPTDAIQEKFGPSGAVFLPLNIDARHPIANDAEIVHTKSPIDALPEITSAVENERNELETNKLKPANQDVVPGTTRLVETEQHTVPLPERAGPPTPSPIKMIQQAFAQSHLPQSVDVLSRPGAVSIEISDSILFETASATLSSAGQQLLNEVATVLADLHYPVSVEGHTDNVPISSNQFPSNWELSSARAAMATRTLIKQGIAADRLRAIGYGETRPRAENNTTEGRSRNRRVSLVLQVDEPERTTPGVIH